MASTFEDGETWNEYLHRIVPNGPRCGPCQKQTNSVCEVFDEAIVDGKRRPVCKKTIHKEDES